MASSTLFVLVVLGTLAQVWGDNIYDPHTAPVIQQVYTITITKTETVMHTLRDTTTTDVWITDHTDHQCVVTDYTTIWEYVPDEPETRVSVITVTSTPVYIVTATTGYNPIKTFVSTFTEFVTTTVAVEFLQSITHIDVSHQVHTIPVVATQELVQQITTTTTYIVTTTITSQGYY